MAKRYKKLYKIDNLDKKKFDHVKDTTKMKTNDARIRKPAPRRADILGAS